MDGGTRDPGDHNPGNVRVWPAKVQGTTQIDAGAPSPAAPRPLCLHVARFDELHPHTLYALLRLRVDVFVVEQACAYPELDGRDTEPGTRHWWFDDRAGAPVTALRTLDTAEGVRIGRVVTAPAARGRGLAGRLLAAALADIDAREVRLDAQTQATGLYRRHGFVPDGPEFLDDGIPHVPMVRRAGQ